MAPNALRVGLFDRGTSVLLLDLTWYLYMTVARQHVPEFCFEGYFKSRLFVSISVQTLHFFIDDLHVQRSCVCVSGWVGGCVSTCAWVGLVSEGLHIQKRQVRDLNWGCATRG